MINKQDVVAGFAPTELGSLRCMECSTLYPVVEAGRASRYRCDCGGVLDVEAVFRLPAPRVPTRSIPIGTNISRPPPGRRQADAGAINRAPTSHDGMDPTYPDSDLTLVRMVSTRGTPTWSPGESGAPEAGESNAALPAGAAWRQLFDERASRLPTWPLSTDDLLLDRSGVWRYRELILPLPGQYIVSRPEGNTGLYPVGTQNSASSRAGHRQIGLYAGLEQFFLKHEGENPTGSFKDRGMTVGVTMAHLLGARAVACASTGNTSASLASYAAQAGMRGIVFLPAGNVAAGKLAQSLAYGATTIHIAGDFDDAMRLVEQVCNESGIYLLNSLNPFRVEGQKAIGFELLQQLGWQAPDWLVLPAGNLGNTSAIGKAFRQARQLGLIGHMPRIAAIQAAGANPFYRSFMQGFTKQERVQAQTIATAIKIGDPVSYTRARRVIEESDGIVEEVSDEEILAAKAVIDRSGIGCEPASAATLAGVRKLVARGIIKGDAYVVGVLTGHLLKDSQTGVPQQDKGVVVEATIDAVRGALEKF